jgi:predicted RNase H-like HicB family nuclease
MDRAPGLGLAGRVSQNWPRDRRAAPHGRYQTGDIAFDLSRRRLGISAATVKETDVKNYIAIVEPSDDGKTWWISFPSLPGITSAADRPEQIVTQARDAPASAVGAGVVLPSAIEDGVVPPSDLSEYNNPLVVLVPYDMPTVAA